MRPPDLVFETILAGFFFLGDYPSDGQYPSAGSAFSGGFPPREEVPKMAKPLAKAVAIIGAVAFFMFCMFN